MRTNRKISDYLNYGEENALTAKRLSAILGITPREITRLIHDARCNGEIILSSQSGYYLSTNQNELQHFFFQMRSRQRAIGAAVEAVSRLLEQSDGQLSLFSDAGGGSGG